MTATRRLFVAILCLLGSIVWSADLAADCKFDCGRSKRYCWEYLYGNGVMSSCQEILRCYGCYGSPDCYCYYDCEGDRCYSV